MPQELMKEFMDKVCAIMLFKIIYLVCKKKIVAV